MFAFCVKNVYNVFIFIFLKCSVFMDGIEQKVSIKF